jgi:16S rRNA (guanine527-N7)-methyltransferase
MIEQLSAAAGRDVSRETYATLNRFVELIMAENDRQNLIASNSVADIWNRHILDGAQLLGIAQGKGCWCDIGSGAGLPGLVIAVLGGTPMTLVEPRRLRADFLRQAVEHLGLAEVSIELRRVERSEGRFDFFTARAVARLNDLFGMACHLAHAETKWVLPKGESVKSELDEARSTWQGSFRLAPSRTHPAAAIVVAEHVQRRGKS